MHSEGGILGVGMGSEAGDRAVPTVNDFGCRVRFGASLVGHGEPRRVLEEDSNIMRSPL